jgi:superfamily I DNA/RNA helicase
MQTAQLAVSRQLLLQLPKLPQKVQKKVYELVEGFELDSKTAARHLEPIHDFKDKRARTARVGDDYRAIIVAPESGNRFLLVYVDHHDEAMRWARNKVFDVHPVLGALQIVDVEAAEASLETVSQGAFDRADDVQLISLGVPAVLLPSVRRVTDEASLQKLAPHLPEEAAEALTWLLAGDGVEEVREAIGSRPPQVDVADLGAALETPDTQRRFVQIRSALALEDLLSTDIEAWRVFLHPDQRRLVTSSFNGPVRVLGGPGTGKTVAAIHRAKHLHDKVWTSAGDKILFTAFSQSLARDIHQSLKRLFQEDLPARLEVTHLHSWAARWLRDEGVKFQIATDEQLREAWDDATGVTGLSRFSLPFVQQEWARVVQAHENQDEPTYLRASRRGRGGSPLKKEDRQFLWSVFSTYREALQSRALYEFVDVVRMARQRLQAQGQPPYKAIIVDETQDFGLEELKLVRALAPPGPNDLFLAGDAHQRLFAAPIRLSQAGIDIRGRGKTLKINYRTTHEIRDYAVRLFGGQRRDDLDGGSESLKGYASVLSGPKPVESWHDGQEAEHQALLAQLRMLLQHSKPEAIALLVRTRELARRYRELLEKAGVPALHVDEKAALDGTPGVRICTLHRSKGLEFHHVLICGLGDDRYPLPIRSDLVDDELATEEHQERERNLLFVGATRARETLWVSGWGSRSTAVDGKRT